MAKNRRRRATRPTREHPERQQDPRLVATQVTAPGGVQTGDWIVAVSPVDMDDGRRLMWHPPQPIAFNLLEAKRFRDRAVRQRRSIMGNLTNRAGDGSIQPRNSHATLDCLSDLVAAVLFSFTAVESLANHAIEMLPDDTVVEVRKGRTLGEGGTSRWTGYR